MQIRVIETGAFFENCYVLWNSKDQAFVVDPGDDAKRILAELQKNELTPSGYLLTHGHLDHISAITALVARHPAPVYLSREDADWAFTRLNGIPPYVPVDQAPKDMDTDLHEGRIITAGTLKARVIKTPGHTPGCVCFAFDEEKVLVSGDTLFRCSIGRTDLPGGSGKRILESLTKLMTLDDDFQVLPGHGGATTIGDERRENPYLAQRL